MTGRRTRKLPMGALVPFLVVAAAGVILVAELRAPRARAPRAERTPVVEAAATPRPATGEPAETRPAAGAKPSTKKKEKKAAPAAPQPAKTVAVPAPALTPPEKEDRARRWAASAAVIAKSRSKKERQQLERHLRRFLGHGPVKPGNWVDGQLRAVRASAIVTAKPLPDPAPDESEQRRLEQLEKLRQRKAVGLLDHIHGGLAWLALHQAPDGHFSDAAAAARCQELGHEPKCTGGKGRYAVACTAFAIMAMLDFRDQDVCGLFEPSLAAAVHWLRRKQRRDGSFPGPGQLYSTAIALMALAQTAESTGDAKLRAAVRQGLERFARQPGPLGGYRYRFGVPGDLSVTGWVVQAVEMARRAGVAIPPRLEPGLSEFLDSTWLGEHRFRYLSNSGERASLYPVGLLGALILWPDPHPSVVASWRRWLTKGVGKKRPRLYTLYYGVRVAIAYEKGLPDPWRRWVFELARSQARKGPAAGAFRRSPGWFTKADKSLPTAVAVLTLEHALYLR